LNFVQGGNCYATGERCILGARGALAKNDSLECELHGRFDVWVMQNDQLLVTDLGFPSEEPKLCLAVGINRELAFRIAEMRCRQLGTSILTTQRKCLRCGMQFWISEHEGSSAPQTGKGYFCPACMAKETEESIAGKMGILSYWCG
jgi:DNA-directed RNA polymerase subunit RPC12/RpoP